MRLPITLVFINLSHRKHYSPTSFRSQVIIQKMIWKKNSRDLISCLENTKLKSTYHETPLQYTEKAPPDAVNFHKSWSFMGFKDNVSSARNFNHRLSAVCVWDYLEAKWLVEVSLASVRVSDINYQASNPVMVLDGFSSTWRRAISRPY